MCLFEFIGYALDGVVYPCADVGMATLVDRSVVLSGSQEEVLWVYFADVQNRMD